MSRAARSSKKQIEFDPNELADLIHHSAVGTGVGLVLLEAIRESVDLAQTGSHEDERLEHDHPKQINKTALPINLTTVGRTEQSTVVNTEATQPFEVVDLVNKPTPINNLSTIKAASSAYMSTVDTTEVTTVDFLTTVNPKQDRSSDKAVSELVAISETPDLIGVAEPLCTPVPNLNESSEQSREVETREERRAEITLKEERTVPVLRAREVKFWITEQGELISHARVKKISRAQDVLNSAEQLVYDMLWTAKTVRYEDHNASKVVQAGYHYLAKQTRLSKKTIQRIVDKLIHKGFLAIEHQADIYTRASTIYRVFSYAIVKERQNRDKRLYVAKIGPGFAYVHEHSPVQLTTVDNNSTSTVVTNFVSTTDNTSTQTVTHSNLSTVVNQAAKIISRGALNEFTSSRVYQALSEYGQVDDSIVNRLIDQCIQIAADCTEEEIIHFVHQKGQLIRGKGREVYSPVGFLVTTVPKCLSGENFRQYREEQRKQREAEAAEEARQQAELAEWKREQQARLSDPSVPEEDKEFICQCLGLR